MKAWAIQWLVIERDRDVQFIAKQPFGEQPQAAFNLRSLPHGQSRAELIMNTGVKDGAVAQQSLQHVSRKGRIKIIGRLGGGLIDYLGNLLKRAALDRALAARIVDEVEPAGKETEQ